MRYPIDNWQTVPTGFRFKQIYPAGFGELTGKPHLGVDKGSKAQYGKPLYATTDGDCQQRNGPEGGLTIHFTDSNGVLIRYLHCSAFTNAEGRVKEGTVLAYMGNTGLVRPAPTPSDPRAGTHTHFDGSKNGHLELNNLDNFIDLEAYFKQPVSMNTYNDKVIRNITTGAFAYVAHDHKQKITNPGALAILTVLDRDPRKTLDYLIETVQPQVWDSIPDTSTPFFPQ